MINCGDLHRRHFLQQASSIGATAYLANSILADSKRESPLTIIDTHTHFYDPTRSEGVPWPRKNSALYRTVLPADYRKVPQPLPVAGTVVVEASSWLEDNQWILDLAKDDLFIVGFVGNISPADDKFATHLKRFAANKLFRGIRISFRKEENREVTRQTKSVCRQLADADLSLDALGSPAMLPNISKIATAVPDLRIVIDHIANTRIDGKEPDKTWRDSMTSAARHKNVFCKVSALVESTGFKGDAPSDVAFYEPILNFLWETFGPQRLIYGSNWPVSDRGATLGTVQKIVYDYFRAKGSDALAAYFSGNAKRAYKWIDRS